MVHVFYNRIKSDLQHDALYKHTYVHFVQQQYQVGLAQAHPNLCKKKILTQVGLFESQLHINYILHLQNSNLQTFISLLKWKIMPPSFRPILMPLSKFLASTKMVGTQNAEKSTFQSTWARELLDPTQLPSWPLGTSAAPKTFLFTPASYSHSTRTLLPSICFISSFFFLGFLESTAPSHQSTEMTLERAACHMKVTCSLC